MVKKMYMWDRGARLDEHTKRKHKILREYFREYLITRCKDPRREKFRIAIVDGFAGGGRYGCGSPGSPLIILEVLKNTFQEIQIYRAENNIKPIAIECLLLLNDAVSEAFDQLNSNIASMLDEIKSGFPNLYLEVQLFNEDFEALYPRLKSEIAAKQHKSTIFILDQYGYSDVNRETIEDIMSFWPSAEVILTFSIGTLLTFLSPDPEKNSVLNNDPEIQKELFEFLKDGEELINKKTWMGYSEKLVFEHWRKCAPFVSPFAINNPEGWRYWLMHFASSPTARRVYNNVLHDNQSHQAHFGPSGLNMLAFDPREERELHLFDEESRRRTVESLHQDVPILIEQHGDLIGLDAFNLEIYNQTPAHSDDIQKVLIESPDIEVLTPKGNPRRSANTISSGDNIRLNKQTTFFPLFRSD